MPSDSTPAPVSGTASPQTGGKKKPAIGLTDIIRFLIPVAVSVGLVVWLFHKVDIHEVEAVIRQGCDFRYIAAMMLLTMLSFIIRGVRWGIQLRAVGIPRLSPVFESVSIFGAYALNLIFPWLGEGWRCVFVSRRTRTPLSTVVGTDIGDRGSDAVVIVILGVVTYFLAKQQLTDFLTRYRIGRDFTDIFHDPYFWIGIIALVSVLWLIGHFGRRFRMVRAVDGSLAKMWAGFKVIFGMKGTGAYLLLTIGIWVCYFLETYTCLYAFPFTRTLIERPDTCMGLLPGLVVFVFGSFSMGVPSNGGLGPWNIAVMFALSLYGIGQTEGTAYSLVVWGFQTIMIVALGIFSFIYISVVFRKTGSVQESGTYSSRAK